MDKTGGIRPSFLENKELEVIFFCGKGGVGKTTCAMVSALLIAGSRPEVRVLLLSTDPAPSLMDSLYGLSPPENLEIKEMDAKEALEKMKKIHGPTVGSIMQLGTIFDEEDTSRLLELSMPGIDEVLGVMEMLDYIESSRYQVIILDTAPTGHTLRLLTLPGELRRWVGLLDTMMTKPRFLQRVYARRYVKRKEDEFIEYMDRRLERFNELLRDGKRCEFVPITIPEALSLEETGRLTDFLQDHRMPVRNIVINQLYPQEGCRHCESLHRLHRRYSEEVKERFTGCNVVEIPLELEEVRGAELLKDFSRALEGLPVSGGPTAGPGVETSARLGLLSRPMACPDAPLLLFVGKGGVGKTTLASATALHLARCHPDKRYLMVSIDPAHSLSDALCASGRLGGKGYSLLPNLLALEVDPRGEFEVLRDIYAEELEGFFDTLTGGRTTIEFEEEVLVELAELSPPGLDEVIALWKVVESQKKEGYDTIILDAAPTGHFLRFIETPGLVEEWLRAIFQLFLKYRGLFRMPHFEGFLVELSKGIKELKALLTSRAVVLTVTTPWAMVMEETRDLLDSLKRSGITPGPLIINMIAPPSASGGCLLCSRLRHAQGRVVKEFAPFLPLGEAAVVYRQDEELRGPEALEQLARLLYQDSGVLCGTCSGRACSASALLSRASSTTTTPVSKRGESNGKG